MVWVWGWMSMVACLDGRQASESSQLIQRNIAKHMGISSPLSHQSPFQGAHMRKKSKSLPRTSGISSRRVTIVRQVHAGGCFAASACPFHYEHAIIAKESIWSYYLRSCFALAAQPCSHDEWRLLLSFQLLSMPAIILGPKPRMGFG